MTLRSSLANYFFDSDRFDQLRTRIRSGGDAPEANRLPEPPRPLAKPPVQLSIKDGDRDAALTREGRDALVAGKVAILVLNGGMATRFGGGAKGIVPVVAGHPRASFLAIKVGQIRRMRDELNATIPVVVMHSFATQTSSAAHLEQIGWGGIPPADRESFAQSVMPRILPDGTPLDELPESRSLPDTDVYAAPGHGDTLGRLRGSGVLQKLRARGVEHVLVSNVDNLGASLDPRILGAHLRAAAEGAGVSVEVVRRIEGDTGGCIAELPGGRPAIIESFRLPDGTDLSDYPHFNTNTLWLVLDAIDREIALDWFAVRKNIAWPEPTRAPDGQLEIVQFETLIGQVTEAVPSAFLEVDRDERFVPIKTRDDLKTQADALLRFARDAGIIP